MAVAPKARRSARPARSAQFNGVSVPVADQLKYFYDLWGSDQTYCHMAVGWTWAFDTPFKWTKQIASHFGGTRQGMCVAWPGHIKDAGGIRNQFHHMIDITPRSRFGGDGHFGAGDGQRHCAEADRRREHDVHVGQGQRQCAHHASRSIFRDVWQPRHL